MNQNKYSFIDILLEKFDGIEIPIIQRDYAQGREHEEKKRGRFLEALKNAVVGNGINLDFIYGSLENNKLIPLDGQQRLTTLFLLHWYTAKRDELAEEKWDCLRKFTYATRVSSQRFCEHLIGYTPDFKKANDTSNNYISSQIKDEAWFPSAWSNDPTIASMLQMLDDIHKKFSNIENLWGKLCDERKITFFFTTLEDIGISDDIYIKMNSRGKLLTDFEHFKAKFMSIIKRNDFSQKIDNDWTNLLWPYRGENNIIDEEFLNYFHFCTSIIRTKTKGSNPDEEPDYLDMISLYEGEKNKENLELLEKWFDCWCHINKQKEIKDYFSDYLSNSEYEKGKVKVYDWDTDLFKDCCKKYRGIGKNDNNFAINKMIMLYAFIIKNTEGKDILDDDFRRRLRILRNLIWNSDDQLRSEHIDTLLEKTKQLILSGNISKDKIDFNSRQKDHEHEKLDWCKENPEHTESLFKLEDHELLYGYTAIADLGKPDMFDKLHDLLSLDLLTLGRALLSIKDYRQTFKNYKIIGNDKKKVWQQLLHRSDQREGFEKTQEAIAELLALPTDITDITKEELIKNWIDDKYLKKEDTPKDWRYYFVKYPKILKKAEEGMFRWEGDNVIIMHKKSYNGHRWNAILFAIYEKYHSEKNNNSEEKKMTLYNWGENYLTLSSGKELRYEQNSLLVKDEKGNVIEKINQNNDIDIVDCGVKLAEKYS